MESGWATLPEVTGEKITSTVFTRTVRAADCWPEMLVLVMPGEISSPHLGLIKGTNNYVLPVDTLEMIVRDVLRNFSHVECNSAFRESTNMQILGVRVVTLSMYNAID